ncbi:MAG: ABC transporter substrate-binding protein, partial [Bdellovibrionales bacterium]|nr:ABC transporter substrate-binding protein [Bdellovibrionales bacterium]
MTHIRSYISHFFIFFLSIVYLLFASSAQSQTAETKTTIEKYPIGIILPLSGSAASYGKYAKNSIDLAYNALPESDRSKIELFYEDDQLISQKSVAAYRKLRAEKNIQAAFVFGSGIGNALVPITEREKVILMAIGASDGSIAKGRQYAFLHWVTPDREATIYAEELKKRDYKRLAIVSYEHEGAIALMNAVKEAMEKIGISDRLVSEQTFVSTDIDFRTHITKLRSLSVDGVILLLFPGSLSSFAK